MKSPQAVHLSEYERKEIVDYPSVYWIGARSKKKLAMLDDEANNYGYDDERGDYLVVPHDHLAYRYEIVDTLGKGSFGQVLHCRDHCTGESVAIKIIRNKKRFHHQALVEIKILDNLRKWVGSLTSSASIPLCIYLAGSRGETSCHQDDGTFLFSKPPVHRDGALEHQSLRAYQSEWIRWLHNSIDTEIHEPNVVVALPDAPSPYSPLRSQAGGECQSTQSWR
jgi:serine/threonine protein kinase